MTNTGHPANTLLCRVRTILALGYCPIFSSIGYWAILLLAVIPNTNTAWTPSYQLPADDCREIGEEVK